MPLMTFKEIVVNILNDLDSDPLFTVSGGEDITATEESRQIVEIVKTTYFNIIDGKDWPHLYKLFQLTATGGSTPTHMTIPTDVMDFQYIKYNVRDTDDTKDKLTDISYLLPKEFMDMVDKRDSSDSDITVVTDTSGVSINVYNDRPPKFWTSFDDKTVVFDAYDSVVDVTNMVASKTQCRGKIYPTVTETDAFVFDLPVDAFSYLLSESKATAFLILKQVNNVREERNSATQRRRMSAQSHKINNNVMYPNYGRRGKK